MQAGTMQLPPRGGSVTLLEKAMQQKRAAVKDAKADALKFAKEAMYAK